MEKLLPNQQSAYHHSRAAGTGDIDQNIYDAIRLYLTDDLGLNNDFARKRADIELQRTIPISVIDSLTASGISVTNTDVLDLGAGLGGMSEELVIRGARVTALEPGAAWASFTRRRVERHRGSFRLLEAFGESIPLPAASFDLVISLQVLEHVRRPDKVLAEVFRVLRPGGSFFLACENYLAFYEGHYKVPWLPMLPKTLGGIYLRMLGRSPRFLYEAVTYTTYPSVTRQCRRLGFVRVGEQQRISRLRSKRGVKASLIRGVALFSGTPTLLFWVDLARNTFKIGIRELLHKPLTPLFSKRS